MIDQHYLAPDVAAVLTMYGGLVGESAWTRSPAEQLARQADRLAEAYGLRQPGAAVVPRNWHPGLAGLPVRQVWARSLTDADFRLALAREHGYADWPAVEVGQAPVPAFEAAVEAVLAGDIDALASMLDADLVTARSHWGHRATLLHHLAANGVEIHRQRVPMRAVAVAGLLLSRGARADATIWAYGTTRTTLDLLVTSAHPRAAGVADELVRVLSSAR